MVGVSLGSLKGCEPHSMQRANINSWRGLALVVRLSAQTCRNESWATKPAHKLITQYDKRPSLKRKLKRETRCEDLMIFWPKSRPMESFITRKYRPRCIWHKTFSDNRTSLPAAPPGQ